MSIENLRFFSNEVSLAQNFRYKGSFATNQSSCQTTRVNVLSHGIKNLGRTFFDLSQSTRLTDGQTDRHLPHG